MKKMKQLFGQLMMIVMIVSLTFTSCKKDEDFIEDEPTPTEQTLSGNSTNGGGVDTSTFVEDSTLFDKVVYRISLDFPSANGSVTIWTDGFIYDFGSSDTSYFDGNTLVRWYDIESTNLNFSVVDTTNLGSIMKIKVNNVNPPYQKYEIKKYLGNDKWSEFEVIYTHNGYLQKDIKLE